MFGKIYFIDLFFLKIKLGKIQCSRKEKTWIEKKKEKRKLFLILILYEIEFYFKPNPCACMYIYI